MTDKLTDNEIIEALESEIHLAEYVDSDYCSNVNLEIIKSALDLINRQQAEIESLKADKIIAERHEKDARELYKDVVMQLKTAKSEAVKEFAKRLKTEIDIRPTHSKKQNECVFFLIDNLVKEMVGENNDS